MKRKTSKVGKLRLSPNEETMLLKEEYERRRKLRLQQVREQQKYISLQIRQKVKQRREEKLHQLEEALRAEWQKAQEEKMKALEKLFLSSLRAVGEGHRQAEENEPDLEALAKQAEERKQRAEKRHKKALKEQKLQKEKLLREQARRIDARKHALDVERERAARVASLPPPLPHPLENLEVKKIPAVKAHGAGTFSVTRFHISEPYVDREMNGEQPDARVVAEEEVKRLEELHRELERERREQLEKAHLRGSHALKKVHLAQDREKLLKELEQMQSMDRMRRRQMVVQMPPQLFVPGYKRVEMKEDWQRELEFAFEDMYSEDRKMKGDLILQFEPQPLPSPCDRSQDNDLDLSLEQEAVRESQQESGQMVEVVPDESESPKEVKTHQPQSKLALKKLLNKIRNQKEEWTSRSEKEFPSKIATVESGTIAAKERQLADLELSDEQHKNSVCEARESVEMLEHKVAPESSIVIHPQEQAAKIRMENERQQWLEQLEQQKQEQLALLKQIEEEKAHLEIQMQTCLEEAKNKKEEEERSQPAQSCSVPSSDEQKKAELGSGSTAVPETTSPGEDSHLQMIRNYQQRLLQQSRLHKQAVSEARSHLHEYQNKLKQRYLTDPVKILSSMETTSVNLKLDSEPLLQRQRMQPAQYQSPGRAGEGSTLSPPHAYNICNVALNASSEKHGEKAHRVCPGKHAHSLEPSHLKLGKFYLPQSCSSQEQVGVLQTSSNEIREPALFQLPSALATRDVSATRTPLEARIQQVRFALPAEDSSEASETEHLKESSLMSNQQMETEAEEEPPPMAPLLSTAKGSPVAQAATADSLACQQGSAESPTRASLEPGTLSGPMSLSREGGVEEFLVSKSRDASLLNYSSILDLRNRLWASSESIQAQQQYLKELQEQLDAHREALLSRQKIQEQLLIQKQDRLKEQMQKQQEALKEFLNKQVRHSSMNGVMTEPQKPDGISKSDFLQDSENYQQENCDMSRFHRDEIISQYISLAGQIEQSEKVLHREQKWRSSRPPVTKVKLGLGLEQHELSVIPEVDTLRSCNISFAGKTDSVGGESSSISTAGEFACRKCYSDALHKEGRSPGSVTSCEEQGSIGSPRQSKQSGLLQELLLMSSENSYDSARSQDSLTAQDVPVLAAAVGAGTPCSGPPFRGTHAEILSEVMSLDVGSEASMQAIPCDLSSTISTGSFLTTETLLVSPVDTGLSSDSMEDQILRRMASSPWESSLPSALQDRQESLSGAPETQLPGGVMCLDKGSQIQQILENCCGELNSENTLAAELDFPETERHLPNFCHQLFQPLEPRPDFTISPSTSQDKIPQDNKELRKTSTFSTQSQDQSTFLEVRTSHLSIQRGSLMASPETSKPNITSEECFKENITVGLEESFHPLQLESAVSDQGQNAARPAGVNVVSEGSFELSPGTKSEWNQNDDSSDRQYEELARSMECIGLQCSMEDMRNESLNSLEEQKSFYQLSTTPVTVDEPFTQHMLKEGVAFKKEILSSEKLPVKVFDMKYVKLPEKLLHVREASKAVEVGSQCDANPKEPREGFPKVQKPLRITEDISLEAPDVYLQAAVQQNAFCLGRHEKHSNSVRGSSSRIPIWETESGHGIMEEPELTLVSSNDISIAESDTEHMNQEKRSEGKTKDPACVDRSAISVLPEKREFLPLVPDTDCSVLLRPDGSSKAHSPNEGRFPSHQTAVMLLESVSAPGSLQESFLKRKKEFIQKSLKRVEEIKQRERKTEKPEGRQLQRRKPETLSRQKECRLIPGKKGAVVHQLKKVGEVKVSSPEDRKAREAEMYQRTSRLYNQLSEVKTRKEEKTRQETYAENRERAKEFQKQMLEKLRAKKPRKAPRVGEASKQETLLH